MTTKALVGTIAAILATLLMAPPPARAGKLTCLTGTDPLVADDARQLVLARFLLIGFNFDCPCGSFDGSPGKTHADWLHCVKAKDDAGVVIRIGYLRPQCKATLLKQLKTAACGYAATLSAEPCVRRSLGSGKVTCAIKPSAQCVPKPGKFTQAPCAQLDCVEAADTSNDGIISAKDSGACAAAAVCGNGVRESLEQCDPPGASCPAGQSCSASCACVTPTPPPGATNTPTRTPVPGAPTNTPTRTPVPGAPTNTPTPSSIGCCMSATILNVTGCIDSSANGFNAVFCGQSQGVWINDDHCTCQSSGPCPGSCVPGTPAPRLTATRTPTRTGTASAPTPTPNPAVGCCANAFAQGECVDSATAGLNQASCSQQSVGGTWVPDQHCSCGEGFICMGSCVAGPPPTATPTASWVDNGNGTISDTQTGLMWEKKDQAGGLHDVNTTYSWVGQCCSGACTGTEPYCQPNAAAASACAAQTGGAVGCGQCSSGTCNVDPSNVGIPTTIWDWLVQLNASNFAGHSNWRIPSVGQDGGTTELETIDNTSALSCGSGPPCVPAAFNVGCTPGCTVVGCSCTASFSYWSATSSAAAGIFGPAAWGVNFGNGRINFFDEVFPFCARAVR
jgi:hypothetical protein